MKVVQINPVCYASTGKIAVEISKILKEQDIENYILYTSGNSNYDCAIKYANDFQIKINALKAKLFGNYGFNSNLITRNLIKELKRINPDVIHLHNLHGHNVNLNILFKYLKSIDVKTIWTFHDCWAFTGYCMYFDYIGCNKWQEQCDLCTQAKQYSWGRNKCKLLYNKKKKLFCGIKNMIIVTPSRWLGELTKKSFMKEYPIKVINNGIDIDVFKPMESNFRQKYDLENKKIILGVAMGFGKRKGYNYFLQLAEKVDDSTKIVLVGTNDEQKKNAPENVICINSTSNQMELAQIYSAADIFVNCTLEDNFPTVNLEALACGTPIITFNTGGSVECIENDDVGVVVEQGDVNGIIANIETLLERENIAQLCREKAEQYYDSKKCFEKYIELYNTKY